MSNENGKTTKTWQQVRSKKKPRVVEVTIVNDDEAANGLDKLRREAIRLRGQAERLNDPAIRLDAEEAEERVEEEIERLKDEDLVTVWRFRTIGREAFEDLIDSHPQTKESKKDHGALPYNPTTFSPAIIAACSIDPELTEEDALELWASKEYSQGELQTLLQGAIDCNTHRRTVDLGNG